MYDILINQEQRYVFQFTQQLNGKLKQRGLINQNEHKPIRMVTQWNNNYYKGIIHDKITNMEYNQGLDHVKYANPLLQA